MAVVFFDEPAKEHAIPEIGRRLRLAPTSVRLHIETLTKEGLIRSEKRRLGSRTFITYKAAATPAFRQIKRAHNLLAIEQSGLIRHLQDTLAPACIVLFGSYRRGEDTEHSDIDLYLEASPASVDVRRFERVLGRKIELHIRQPFAEYPQELKNNIANGIVLAGYLEAYQ